MILPNPFKTRESHTHTHTALKTPRGWQAESHDSPDGGGSKRNFSFIIKSLLSFVVFYFLVSVIQSYLSIGVKAAIPNSARIIPFQGVLTNSSGNYVADGNYDMVFGIYSVASAGTALWSTTHSGANAVPVTNGAFSVNIGSLDVNGVNISMDTPPYYLGIEEVLPQC